MEIILVSKTDLENLSKNISSKVDENGLMIFQGFHYFSPKSFLGNYEQKYLLALKDKKIIGV